MVLSTSFQIFPSHFIAADEPAHVKPPEAHTQRDLREWGWNNNGN